MTALLDWFVDTTPYRQVGFEFAAAPVLVGTLLCGVAVLVVYLWWRRGSLPASLAVARAVVCGLVAFLVLGPTLVGWKSVPGSQFVLLLFDDSRSMTVRDPGGETRGRAVVDALASDNRVFEREVEQRHRIARYRFGADVHRVRSADALRFEEGRTDLTGAVSRALDRAAGTEVAAVVLFSDGIQQSREPFPVDRLPTDVPVFTVGAGRDDRWPSLALTDLSVSRSPFDESPVQVSVGVSAHGLVGERAVIEIVDGNRRVVSDAFEIRADSLVQKRRLEFVPDRPGWIAYRSRVRLADQPFEGITPVASDRDPVTADNVRDFVVDNRARTFRILFFSGRPNWEHKFVRRALSEDRQLETASLIRISGAEKKFVFRGNEASMSNPLFEGYDDDADLAPRYDEAVFLRIGVGQSELTTGYPLEAEDLYPFHAVIWSEIESDFFSTGHLELTRSFVSERGGSLLLLGGPRSLAEGGYAGSVIEPLLPIVLPSNTSRRTDWSLAFHPRPTVPGVLSGIWSLDPDPSRNEALWRSLPLIHGVNEALTTRAGADILSEAVSRTGEVTRPLFAMQRYGEGTSAVLATGETWPWQMLPLEPDPAHGRFWRQMIRSLLATVPDPVVFPVVRDAVAGEPLTLATLVRDSTFVERESLVVDARLTAPHGVLHRPAVEESIAESGVYTITHTPSAPGAYGLSVTARDLDGRAVAVDDYAFIVHPDDRELRTSRYDPENLRRISAHTGGRFFPLDRIDEIPDLLPWRQTRDDQVDRIALWNAPPFYLLLLLLLIPEWYVRRTQGRP